MARSKRGEQSGSCVIRSDIEMLSGFLPTIGNINQLLQLLAKIDEAVLCIGNANSKFDELISNCKGYFKNSSGKYSFIASC